MRNNTHVLGSIDDGGLHNNKGDQNIRDIRKKKTEEYHPTYMYLSLWRTGSLKSLMRSSASSLTTVCSSRYLRGIFWPSSFTVFDSETKAALPVSGKMLTNITLSFSSIFHLTSAPVFPLGPAALAVTYSNQTKRSVTAVPCTVCLKFPSAGVSKYSCML